MIDRPLRQTIYFIRHNPVMLLSLGAVIFFVSISLFSLNAIYESSQRQISNHLQSSLETSVDQLTGWKQQQIRTIEVIKNTSSGSDYLQKLFDVSLTSSREEVQEAFELWLYPIIVPLGFEGYSLLSPEKKLIASSSKNYIGKVLEIDEVSDVVERSRKNTSAVSLPFRVDDIITGPEGSLPSGILIQIVCTSVYKNNVLHGFFCLRTNPQDRFFPIFYAGRTGSTGEVYAIDQKGRIITPSRFAAYENIAIELYNHTRRLKDIYAVSQTENKANQGNQSKPSELSPLAQRVIGHELQKVIFDYHDYRGKEVVGAGRWLDDLNIGLIVEQDSSEVFKPYEFSRRIIIALSISALITLIVLTVSAIMHRISMAKREVVFRSMLDNIPLPIYLMSQNGKIEIVNPALCQLLNLESNKIIDKWPDEISIPGYLKHLFSEKYDKEPESRFFEDETVEINSINEDLKYFRVLRFPVKGEANHMVSDIHYIATILVDVTERIIASEKLAEINQKLERLVDERTQELMVAKDRAEEASNAKAEFLANVSHEIRTPLNAIIGLSHVALAANVDDQVKAYLEKMRGSGQHLLRVINDILNFSRLEAGKLELDSSNFLLEDLVDNVVDMVWDRAHSKGVEIQVHVSPGIPHTFKGDPLRLGQILINFMANAVKFTEQGKIEFNINLKSDIESFATIEFEIKDTGIGIPEEKLATLFQPFRQIDSSSTRRFEGSGLGLAISKDLADLMGGIIEVDSQQGVGSSFRLLVTLQDVSESDVFVSSIKAENVLSERARRINANILLVEDNRLNQEVAEALLSMSGCEVTTVSSGAQAVEVMKHDNGSIDVILMDIQMPVMDGVETTRELRKLDKCEYIPIIAMTANVLSGDREKYLNSGMDDYIAKPIDPEQLVTTLQKWVNEEKIEKVKDYELDLALEPAKLKSQIQNQVKHQSESRSQSKTKLQQERLAIKNNVEAAEKSIVQDPLGSGKSYVSLSSGTTTPSKTEDLNNEHSVTLSMQDLSQQNISFLILKNEGVDTEAALHNVMGNSELYTRLLVRFVQERSEFIAQMQDDMHQNRWEMVLNEVHSLGSLAGTLGLNALMYIARQVEQQLKNNEVCNASIHELFTQLQNDLTMLQAWMFLSGEEMEKSPA